MLLSCPACHARVDATVNSQTKHQDEETRFTYRASLCTCPSCGDALLATEDEVGSDQWSQPTRVWPPERRVGYQVPAIVRNSLEEGDKCFVAGVYSAAAVMCGRALEGICIHHKTKKKTLHDGLRELLDRKVIDERLFEWGQELRKTRNLGAHATEEVISREDAQDVLDFAHAISEYVFVLNERFERFMKRQRESQAKPE